MFKLFLFMLLLAPLPFGAYRPWAWSLFAVIFALIGVYICISAFIGRSSIHLTLKPVRYSLLLVLVPIGWAFLQYSTWVPAAWMHPFWQIAAQQLPVPVQGTISLDPYETGTALMKLLSYFVIFFISLQYNRDYENTVLTFKGLSYVGLVYAIYGLVLYLGKFDTLLWFDREFPMNGVASTFINRNSYATYAGLTLLASFPVLFDKIQSMFVNLTTAPKRSWGLEFMTLQDQISALWSPLNIGNCVTIGHGAVLHACTVKDYVLIGMGAVLLDDCVVEPYSIVAAGSLVRQGFTVPSGMLVAGVPAKVMRPITEDERRNIEESPENYVRYSQNYLEDEKAAQK